MMLADTRGDDLSTIYQTFQRLGDARRPKLDTSKLNPPSKKRLLCMNAAESVFGDTRNNSTSFFVTLNFELFNKWSGSFFLVLSCFSAFCLRGFVLVFFSFIAVWGKFFWGYGVFSFLFLV
ncbi:hypothetical protein FPQ18DRAFT_315428 [Pyronema domesticum]|nr:hypothetical protein FPQ18DRAFT_315428 [Pyronema domesticum]